MNTQTMKSRIRGWGNSFILNPLFTSCYDRIRPTSSLGEKGERAAERYLLRRGHVIVGRGYQDSFGEIDIVSVKNRTIVFVEVKTRSSDSAGSPLEAVNDDKQARITRTATSYLKKHELLDCRSRFDVIAVYWPRSLRRPRINHITHAFEAHNG